MHANCTCLQDSEQQMILTARRSLVSKMSRNQPPRLELFFLNINVRRSHLVVDSLNEVIIPVDAYFFLHSSPFLFQNNRTARVYHIYMKQNHNTSRMCWANPSRDLCYTITNDDITLRRWLNCITLELDTDMPTSYGLSIYIMHWMEWQILLRTYRYRPGPLVVILVLYV